MRLLFLGDVVGRSGREAVIREMPALRDRFAPDLVVVNGENAAGGFGITETIYDESLIDAGADVVTLGNHAFDQRETLAFIERAPICCGRSTYPAGTPGRGAGHLHRPQWRPRSGRQCHGPGHHGGRSTIPSRRSSASSKPARSATACDAVDRRFPCRGDLGEDGAWPLCDGRASLVVGTHTHVPTADHQILPGGTAYYDRCRHVRRL